MATTAPDIAPSTSRDWHAVPIDTVATRLGAAPVGLTDAEAAARLARHGPNALPDTPPTSVAMLLVRQVRNPLIAVLFAATFARVIGVAVGVAALLALAIGLARGEAGADVFLIAVTVTTMALYQVVRAGNARSETRSIFRVSPLSNPFLFIATAPAR